ncbi:MAG: hypothetical protein KGM15_17400, partial [Pseudomonadota bacterium]|nr:hypothetical protein [Pseudomonadota bacterium]
GHAGVRRARRFPAFRSSDVPCSFGMAAMNLRHRREKMNSQIALPSNTPGMGPRAVGTFCAAAHSPLRCRN